MAQNKVFRVLIISDTVTDLEYSKDRIDNIDYKIVIEYCNNKLANIESKCNREFNLIISETFNFTLLKQKHYSTTDEVSTPEDLVHSHFFEFHGRFVLINHHVDEGQVRNLDSAYFPNCKTFKRKIYTETTKFKSFIKIFSSYNVWANIKSFRHPENKVSNDENFIKFLKKEVRKSIAVENDFLFTGLLFWHYIFSLQRSYRILIQFAVIAIVSLLFLVDFEQTRLLKKQLGEMSSYLGFHLFNPNLSAIRPVSVLLTVFTCCIYWRWYIRDLFKDINEEVSRKGFKKLYNYSLPLLVLTILLSLLKLFEGQIAFAHKPIYSYNTELFLFKDYFIIFLLTLIDVVILKSSLIASKSTYITRYTKTKLQNIYDLTFQTILFCDLPILIGSILLSYQEQYISYPESRTAYQIGATASSLFILQLIYFFINFKSSYKDYLSS